MSANKQTAHGLSASLGTWQLWGIAVGLVISGEYFGWSFGWASAGTLGFLVTTVMVAVMYGTFIFSFTELTTSIPNAGGPFAYARRAFGPTGGLIAGFATLVEFVFAPPAIALAIGAYLNVQFPALDPKHAAVGAYVVFMTLNILGVSIAATFELFVTVIDEGSITRAAQRMGITQSAVSHLLDKLRAIVGDPLFVRQGNSMVPTELTRRVIGEVQAHLRGLQFGHIAHAAIHHQARPAVVRSGRCQIATHQSPAQRTCTIYHQHPPMPGRLHRRFYLGVVFVALHRGDLAGKRGHAAVAVPGRGQHAKLAAGIVFMGIAKIAGTESGRGHSSHGKSWEINTGATRHAQQAAPHQCSTLGWMRGADCRAPGQVGCLRRVCTQHNRPKKPHPCLERVFFPSSIASSQ